MILRLTEGSLAPIDCLEEELSECPRNSGCVTRDVWKELYDAICGVVDRITLQDLVDKQQALIPYDFSI